MSEPLYNLFRPQSFDEVIGQPAVVKSLKKSLASKTFPHAILLHGPKGIGKTSIARVIAKELGCVGFGLKEFDAASNGQIDKIREIVDSVPTRVIGSPVKVYIIDEAHAITDRANESFLKTVEEPPEHVYFIFVTTDPEAIVPTIRDRCTAYPLKAIADDVLREHVEAVATICFEDKIFDHKIESDVLDLVVASAEGSVRRALVNLNTVSTVDTLEEAADLLPESAVMSPQLKEIAKLLLSGCKDWNKYQSILKTLPADQFSGARPMLYSYLTVCEINTTVKSKAEQIAVALDAIEQMPSKPLSYEHKGSLVMAIWRVILS